MRAPPQHRAASRGIRPESSPSGEGASSTHRPILGPSAMGRAPARPPAFDFSRLPLHPPLQARRAVSEPGDASEQEADRFADEVTAPATPATDAAGAAPAIRALPEASTATPELLASEEPVPFTTGEAPRDMRDAPDGGSPPSVDRKAEASAPANGGLPQGMTSRLAASRGMGTPLPSPVRTFFEPRLGYDLGPVRVHTTTTAARMSRQLDAQAFTHGRDVYFGSGHYNPSSSSGRWLLAHELAHVVQQGHGTSGSVRLHRKGKEGDPTPGEHRYRFNIKVRRVLPRDEAAVVVLQQVFSVSENRARELLQFMKDQNIQNLNYPGFRAEDVKAGKQLASFDVGAYEALSAHLGRGTSGQGDASKSKQGAQGSGGGEKKPPPLPPALKGKVNAETDRRYWERTGDTPGKPIGKSPKDQDQADLWKNIQQEVLAQLEALRGLAPDAQELMGGATSFQLKDLEQLQRIAKKVEQMSPEDRMLFRLIAKQLTGDLNRFEQSVDVFLGARDKYRADLEALAKQQQAARGGEPSLQEQMDAAWKDFDTAGFGTLGEQGKQDLARARAAKLRNIQLQYMVEHPGETGAGMVKGLSPVEMAKGVAEDVRVARDPNKSGFARWAAGFGAGSKTLGWAAGVAGVLYVALLFVPGVNVVQLATTALVAGVAALVMAGVEAELSIQAAGESTTVEDFKEQTQRAATAQTNVIVGAALIALGLALKLSMRIRLPGRYQNVGHALRMAREALAKQVGITTKFGQIQMELLAQLREEGKGLPQALTELNKGVSTTRTAIQAMTGDELLNRIIANDAALKDLIDAHPDLVETAKQAQAVAKTHGGQNVPETVRENLLRSLTDAEAQTKAHADRFEAELKTATDAIQKALTPEELKAALDAAEKRFGQEELQKAVQAAHEKSLKQRVEEERYRGMTEKDLQDTADADPKAKAELDRRAEVKTQAENSRVGQKVGADIAARLTPDVLGALYALDDASLQALAGATLEELGHVARAVRRINAELVNKLVAGAGRSAAVGLGKFLEAHPSWRLNAAEALCKMLIEGATNPVVARLAAKLMAHADMPGMENWAVLTSRQLKSPVNLMEMEVSLDDAIRQSATHPGKTEMEIYYYEGKKLTYEEMNATRQSSTFDKNKLKNIDVETPLERREWKRVREAITNDAKLTTQVKEARLKFKDAELPRGSGGKLNVGIVDYSTFLDPSYTPAKVQQVLKQWLAQDTYAMQFMDRLEVRFVDANGAPHELIIDVPPP
ncbi:DUF4157 domain-containing protein [Corallococcus sp. Z5C101001]|nr:DUF4157 domain-containing protein [Corallococcus sp. Z5C101001]